MDFVTTLNNSSYLLYLSIFIVIGIGIIMGFKNGGWNRHLPYFFTLIIYFQYILVTPMFFYGQGRNYLYGSNISNYYGLGAFFNLLAVFSFVMGYWISGFKFKDRWNQEPVRVLFNAKKWIAVIFYSLYGIIVINMAVGGLNISEIFLGSQGVGLGAKGATYYIQNFADSLIALIIMAYLFNISKRQLAIFIVLSFFLFSLLGFRYRILLSLFGLGFVYLYRNKVTVKQFFVGLMLVLTFMYLLMFSTQNRSTLIARTYDDLVFNPGEFNYYSFFEQSRGALADMAIYRLYDDPNKNIDYDYGLSMTVYVFIRLIPRAIMENKDDYYPPPQLRITLSAYDAWYAKTTGEASLSTGALYIAFGWLGIVLGHFFWALSLRKYSNKIVPKDNISLMKYIILALITFQWITRGYVPQVIDHAVYLLIPVFILTFLAKKKKKNILLPAKAEVKSTPGNQIHVL